MAADPSLTQQAPIATTRAVRLKAIPFPGAKAKEAVKDLAGEYITEPLAKAGHPDVGAALGAGVATAADVAIPEDWTEAAMAIAPVGLAKKGLKIAGKLGDEAMELFKKLDSRIEKATTLGERNALLAEKKALKDMAAESAPAVDYGAMKADRHAARATAEDAAPTIDYGKFNPTIPPGLVAKKR